MQSIKTASNGSDLNFNVSQILKEQVGATRTYTVEEKQCKFEVEIIGPEPVEDRFLAENLLGQVKFTRISQGILVNGKLEADVTQECARCLEDSHVHVAFEMTEEFRPTVDLHTGLLVEEEEEEGEDETEYFVIDGNHILDLSEAVRQNILVSLPMQPLCRPDCQGICPTCGQNRNNVQCNCEKEQVDSRFSVLQSLLGPE